MTQYFYFSWRDEHATIQVEVVVAAGSRSEARDKLAVAMAVNTPTFAPQQFTCREATEMEIGRLA